MNANWLAQLAPEHAPPAPGWWPLAMGWWGAIALLVVLTTILLWWWRNPRRRQRRAALQELLHIREHATEIGATARAIENLMRRYAMAIFGRDVVAKLSGDTWLAFVVDHGSTPLSGATGRSLLKVAFGGKIADSDHREQWFAGADAFLRRAGRRRKRSTPR